MTVEQVAPGGQQEQQPAAEPSTELKPPEGGTPEPKTYDEPYVSDLRKESAKYRTANKALEKELETLRQASMSADEKALAEAEARGRTAASTEWGSRLARSEFNAQAAKRNPEFKPEDVMDFVDLSKFVGEDGEPDVKAISSAVERLVPEPSNAPPSFDGGHRSSPPKGSNFSDVIRGAAGRG